LAQGKESSAAINDPLFSVTRLFFPSQFALCALKTAATNILACAKLHNPGALVGNFWRAKPGKFSRVPKDPNANLLNAGILGRSDALSWYAHNS